MLKKTFQDHQKKPVILVGHECDDPARGDASGRKGLAEAMGRSHGGKIKRALKTHLGLA